MTDSSRTRIDLSDRLGSRWHAVSVNDTEFDLLGKTPAVELVDASDHEPSHFQSVPLSKGQAEAISATLVRNGLPAPELVDFQGDQYIVRIPAHVARQAAENTEIRPPIATGTTRF